MEAWASIRRMDDFNIHLGLGARMLVTMLLLFNSASNTFRLRHYGV